MKFDSSNRLQLLYINDIFCAHGFVEVNGLAHALLIAPY